MDNKFPYRFLDSLTEFVARRFPAFPFEELVGGVKADSKHFVGKGMMQVAMAVPTQVDSCITIKRMRSIAAIQEMLHLLRGEIPIPWNEMVGSYLFRGTAEKAYPIVIFPRLRVVTMLVLIFPYRLMVSISIDLSSPVSSFLERGFKNLMA